MFAQGLRRFVHCLRSISMFAHVLYVCAIQMLHALNEIIPHLKTSSRGAEAPTYPETSSDGDGEEARPGRGRIRVRAAATAAATANGRQRGRGCRRRRGKTREDEGRRRKTLVKFVHASLGIRTKGQLPRRCVHRRHAINTAAGLCKHRALLVSVAPKETPTRNDIPLDP